MKKITFLTLLSLLIKITFAQNTQTDSLTFSTEKGLLIFDGYLNGVKTDFAFDTGASLGLLNSDNVSDSKIEISGSKNIRDSQKNFAKIGKAKISSLNIGSHQFTNINSVVADMSVLKCGKIYLLGGDVINLLNWKFDFTKSMVYISKTPFQPKASMSLMPIKIIGNRHFSNLTIAGTSIENILIDFGYTGNCTMNMADKTTKQIISKIKPTDIYLSKSFSMGVNSISVGKETSSFYVNQVNFGEGTFDNFKINAMPNTHNKIGLFFIKKNFTEVILNNTELKYWLQPNHVIPQKNTTFDAGFYFNDNNSIEVVSLNGAINHTAVALKIGESISEINNRKANSFANRCEFSAWYLTQLKLEELAVTKENGEKFIIKKSVY